MEKRPPVRQGEAALLVRLQGTVAHSEQGTLGRKLRLKALGWGGRCRAGAWACRTRVRQQLPCGRAGRRWGCLQREKTP